MGGWWPGSCAAVWFLGRHSWHSKMQEDLSLVGCAPAEAASSSAAAGGDPALVSGKPSKGDDPGPVRQALSKAQKQAMAEKKAAARVRDAKLDEAGAVAARELKAAQVGVVRSSLFDANDFKREHNARQDRMEQTFSRLYKPQAGEYCCLLYTSPSPRDS